MSCFEWAVQTVLNEEGGFVNDPQDSGGATKYGISVRWLNSLGSVPKALAGTKAITVKTVQQLTREQAVELYRCYFWQPPYARLISQPIANKVFSFSVNAGSCASHKALQWALHATGCRTIVVDGKLGEQTIQAANVTEVNVLLAALRSEMAGYYRSLNQPHFEAGWLKRAYA